MKIGTFDGKLVEEVGGANGHIVFLTVVKDEDKDKCPHCGKPVPTKIVSIVSSPNHQSMTQEVAKLTK